MIKDVRVSLNKNDIGWTFWDYRDCEEHELGCGHTGFGLFIPNNPPDLDVIKALGRKKP